MNVYILQENYTEYVPEAGWDDNGSYDEDVEHHDVVGVFATLDDAVRKLVETFRFAKALDVSGDKYWNYDILVGDTETTEVRSVLYKEYEELLKKFDK